MSESSEEKVQRAAFETLDEKLKRLAKYFPPEPPEGKQVERMGISVALAQEAHFVDVDSIPSPKGRVRRAFTDAELWALGEEDRRRCAGETPYRVDPNEYPYKSRGRTRMLKR